MSPTPKIKAIFFDFMGTCLDWHTSILSALPSSLTTQQKSKLAISWREKYFDSNAARLVAGKPPEDVDVTLRETLDVVLSGEPQEVSEVFDEGLRKRCVRAWHSMRAWPDVPGAIEGLKAAGYEVFVFGNGTVRLQLDLCRSSGLKFDMLFSSELLDVYKPSPRSYEKVLGMVGVKPEEAVMVAAHAYDVRCARRAGMRTVYSRRWTDDTGVDMGVVRRENDAFLEGMGELVEVVGRF